MSERNAVSGCMNTVGNGCSMMIVNVVLLLLIALMGYFFYNSWYLHENGVTTTGVVLSLEAHSSSEGGDTYSPVVSFTAEGRSYTFEGSNSSDPPEYRVGEKVTVRYDPANPERADVDNFFTSPIFWGLVIGVLVIVWLILNIIFAVRTMRGQSLDEGE